MERGPESKTLRGEMYENASFGDRIWSSEDLHDEDACTLKLRSGLNELSLRKAIQTRDKVNGSASLRSSTARLRKTNERNESDEPYLYLCCTQPYLTLQIALTLLIELRHVY